MKYLPAALALFLVVAALLSFAPVKADTAVAYTWHIQDSAGNPINQATVDIQDHSAQMTGSDGEVIFNFFNDSFPITITVTADGYNSSGPLTFTDPAVRSMTVTLLGDGPIIGSHAGTLCGGAAAICAAIACGCLIVSRKTQ